MPKKKKGAKASLGSRSLNQPISQNLIKQYEKGDPERLFSFLSARSKRSPHEEAAYARLKAEGFVAPPIAPAVQVAGFPEGKEGMRMHPAAIRVFLKYLVAEGAGVYNPMVFDAVAHQFEFRVHAKGGEFVTTAHSPTGRPLVLVLSPIAWYCQLWCAGFVALGSKMDGNVPTYVMEPDARFSREDQFYRPGLGWLATRCQYFANSPDAGFVPMNDIPVIQSDFPPPGDAPPSKAPQVAPPGERPIGSVKFVPGDLNECVFDLIPPSHGLEMAEFYENLCHYLEAREGPDLPDHLAAFTTADVRKDPNLSRAADILGTLLDESAWKPKIRTRRPDGSLMSVRELIPDRGREFGQIVYPVPRISDVCSFQAWYARSCGKNLSELPLLKLEAGQVIFNGSEMSFRHAGRVHVVYSPDFGYSLSCVFACLVISGDPKDWHFEGEPYDDSGSIKLFGSDGVSWSKLYYFCKNNVKVRFIRPVSPEMDFIASRSNYKNSLDRSYASQIVHGKITQCYSDYMAAHGFSESDMDEIELVPIAMSNSLKHVHIAEGVICKECGRYVRKYRIASHLLSHTSPSGSEIRSSTMSDLVKIMGSKVIVGGKEIAFGSLPFSMNKFLNYK